MATRGTAILILNDTVLMGPEFNGDMYPARFGGHGDNFMNLLSDVNDNVEFIKMNNRFNKHEFGYDKIMNCYQGKHENKKFIVDNVYDVDRMVKLDDEYLVTSDWMFIKNKTDKRITLNDTNGKNVRLESGETIRLYFGELLYDNNNHRVKAS